MVSTFFEIKDRAGRTVAIQKRIDHADGSKSFAWLGPDGRTGLNGTATSDLPLFNIDLIDEWPADEPVVVGEGPKVAAALRSIGIPAVATVTGAASTPSEKVLADLSDRKVILAPDNDEPGRAHMRRVGSVLDGIAAVGWLPPPSGKPVGWDLADAIAEGMDVRALLRTATDLPKDAVPSLPSLVSPQSSWPEPLAPEAFHGLAGDFTRAIEPYTEADPAATHVSFVVTVGALAGPEVRAMAGDAEHPAKLYGLIGGETSNGRKGTSFAPVRTVARLVDPDFAIAGGLSSGEGLIYQVRDPIEKTVMVGRGADRHAELQVVDEGVEDKRLLVFESEFAGVLRVLQRDGNSLSPVMRTAWDSGDLRTLTKNSPVRATGAHIAVLAHVSREELLRHLDRTDLANGFVNRFLIIAARRQRLLPRGGNVPLEVLRGFADRLRDVLEWAREPRLLERDETAERMWAAVYEQLSEGRPGLLGAATNRAEALALRLQVAYAILDRSPVIRAEHVLASLAVWRYAEESARWVFGDALGDTVADAILEALRLRGEMSRTDINDLFGRHVPRHRIEQALNLLLAGGRISWSREQTAGRPREVFRCVTS